MLTSRRSHRTCDGVTRRSFLRVGALGVGGLTLPGLLRYQAQRGSERPQFGQKKAVILVWLAGGPSHIDMYDLKPDAPAEFRGEFKPIATNVPGIADRRAPAAAGADHGQAGRRPLGVPHQRRPRHGLAVDAHRLPADDRGQRQHLPGVRLGRRAAARGRTSRACRPTSTCRGVLGLGKAAYLGRVVQPVRARQRPERRRLPGPQPEAARPRERRPAGPPPRAARRSSTRSAATSTRKGDLDGLDTFYRDALEMVTSDKAQQGVRHQQGRPASSATGTAATTWARAACWPGGWSRRA